MLRVLTFILNVNQGTCREMDCSDCRFRLGFALEN